MRRQISEDNAIVRTGAGKGGLLPDAVSRLDPRDPGKLDRSISGPVLDCVVIGAGPAGLQSALFLKSAGRKFAVLEARGIAGSFFQLYPRSRILISFNKVNSIHDDPETNLRWDWNSLLSSDSSLRFSHFSTKLFPTADEMVSYLGNFAERLDLPVRFGSLVTKVSRLTNGMFSVDLDGGESYECRYVIVATGMSLPYVPPIPGIGLAEGYESVDMDPRWASGLAVLILGKGNSAMEVADRLIETAALVHIASPTPITLAWKTRHPGHLRTNHARLLDMYQLKMLNSVLDCRVEAIRHREGSYEVDVVYSHADGERDVLVYDRVVRCTGFQFDTSIFSGLTTPLLSTNDRLPDMTPNWESTNVPGLFFAGTLMQARDFRRAGSAFIDGFRYNIRTLTRILGERFHGEAYPRKQIDARAEPLADVLLRRASTTSALWVQFRHLCDVIVVDDVAQRADHFEELPVDVIPERFGTAHFYFTLNFEWGEWDGDIFAIERHPSHESAGRSVFLHPVVRHFRGGKLASEHHLLEDLVGVYHPDYTTNVVRAHSGAPARRYHSGQHVQPLVSFLTSCGIRRATDPVEDNPLVPASRGGQGPDPRQT